jgi:acyl carrier protein
MVPAAYVVLESLPLTANGKLDRQALPAPEGDAYARKQYEAPQGEIEQTLASVWQALLAVERVGRHDNFFELGGHSLLAVQVVVRVRSEFSVEISVKKVFAQPTLAKFAAEVATLREQQLTAELARGGKEIEEIFERVSSLSEAEVEDLMQRLKRAGSASESAP